MKGVMRWAAAMAIFLMGLLALSYIAPNAEVTTSAHSYGPSGTHLLIDLLRSRGYNVVIDNALKPRLPDNVLVLGILTKPSNIWGEAPQTRVRDVVQDWVHEGGKAVLAELGSEFDDYNILAPSPITDVFAKKEYRYFWDSIQDLEADSDGIPVFTAGRQNVIMYEKQGLGRALNFGSVMPMTNRYLARGDNAEVIIGAIERFYPSGTIVVADGLSGQVENPSLLAAIGKWFQFGWWQILLIFVLFIYTQNRRLGLAEAPLPVQKGQRELVDAIGIFWNRGQATEMAMAALVKDADRSIRQALKLSLDTPVGDRDQHLSPTLLRTLAFAERMSQERFPLSEVLPVARTLIKEVSELGESRRSVRRRSKFR